MTNTTATKEYTLDAQGQKLGRLATEVANLLRGKNAPDFQPNKLSGNKVTVVNASLIEMAPIKFEREYFRHSGFPGGGKFEKRSKVIDQKGYKAVFEKAVYGMLPANKLRKQFMKNLTIQE